MVFNEPSKICVHIGYHKTASSWMQVHAFHIHPDIVYLNPPQSNFEDFWNKEVVESNDFSFSKERIIQRIQQELNKSDNSGKVFLVSEENLSGNIYSGYNARRNAERIFDLFGKCKIFIVIRNQVAYIISAYSNYINEYGSLSFKAWLNDYEIPVRMIYQKLCYDKLIEFYMSLFGSSNVMILPFEIIKSDGGISLMKKFFTFAGVRKLEDEVFTPIIGKTVNVRLSPATLRIKRLVNGLVGGNSINQRRVFRAMDRFVLRYVPLQPCFVTKKQKEYLQNYFRDSNQRTSKLIGVELAKYGYPT